MTIIQRRVVSLLSLISLIVGVAWQIYDPGFEPWLFVTSGLIGIFTQWWPMRGKRYNSERLSGTIKFNYSSNDGRYAIGRDDLLFETAWSKASNTSIHIYNDPPSIDSVAIAYGVAKINDLRSIMGLDFSSRSRNAQVGDIVVLKNKFGKYAAIKVKDVKVITGSDVSDEIAFEYVINPDGGSDFR